MRCEGELGGALGTFHHDTHPLHGITVVVETKGPLVYIGRCDTMDEGSVVLLDADEHESDGPEAKAAYIARAAAMGIWGKHRRLVVPLTTVLSVRPLYEYAS